MRSTKIIATLGPATDAPQVLARMFTAGVNVVRVNFSHGSAEDRQKRVTEVRRDSAELGLDVGGNPIDELGRQRAGQALDDGLIDRRHLPLIRDKEGDDSEKRGSEDVLRGTPPVGVRGIVDEQSADHRGSANEGDDPATFFERENCALKVIGHRIRVLDGLDRFDGDIRKNNV